MRKVFTIGEILLDIIFKNKKTVEAKPGGSMLNTAVSLGSLDMRVFMVGDCAKDSVGDLITEFLKKDNVSVDYIKYHSEANSKLALAFLDVDKNADYLFYKSEFKNRIKYIFPDVRKNDIILFGSFFSINKIIREQLIPFIKYAKSQEAIIIYDPNFRSSHLNMLDDVIDFIIENIKLADIVKASDEDFKNIFNVRNPDDSSKIINSLSCKNLIYTSGENNVSVRTSNMNSDYEVPKIIPESTVGAGDTFSAGLIYSLLKENILFDDINKISKMQWDRIIKTSIEFAQDVCMSFDNYISEKLAEKYRNNIE